MKVSIARVLSNLHRRQTATRTKVDSEVMRSASETIRTLNADNERLIEAGASMVTDILYLKDALKSARLGLYSCKLSQRQE